MEDEEIDDFVTPYGCSTFVRDEEMALKKKTQHTCTECQESFVSRPELVTHMEACVTEAFDHEVHSVQNEIRTTFPESGQFPQNVTQGREKAVALFTTHMFQRKRQFSMPGSDFNLTMVPHEIRLTKPGIKMHRIQGGEQREEEADVVKEHTQPLIEQEHEPRRKKMKRPVVDDTLYTFPYPAPFPYPDKPEVVVKATMRVKCPDCFRELLPKNFKEHYRIHTGEMPYPCYFCDKRFRLTHAKMHDCKTPCECHDCDFRCVLPITMDKHRKEEHGDDGSGIEIVSDSAHHNVVVRPPPKPTRRPEFPMTAEQQEADTAANSISIEPEAPIRHLQDYDYDFDDLFGDIPEGPVGELPLPQEPFNFNLKNNNNNDIFIEENDIYIEDDDQIVPY